MDTISPFVVIILSVQIQNVWSIGLNGTKTETVDQLNWKSHNLTEENHNILDERSEFEQKLIDDVAVRGDVIKEYRIQLRLMNLLMRKHHAEMRSRVGHNLYPLILALDTDHDKRLSGVGSEYILYLRNGTVQSMKPTPIEYETNKNLAHMALGIFSIISPFFKNPTSTGWQRSLKEYKNMIESNIQALHESNLNNTMISSLCDEKLTVEDQEEMLSMAHKYIDDCFELKSVDIEGYANFTKRFQPFMQKALKCAAEMQVKAGVNALGRWKEQLGPKLWRDVYVVIPVIWPVARVNPRQLIFEKLLDADRGITHIIKAEGVTTIAEARDLLGRIVADRSMAHFVFGSSDNLDHTDSNLSLSTRRDIVASNVIQIINRMLTLKPMEYYVTASDLRYDEDGPPSS